MKLDQLAFGSIFIIAVTYILVVGKFIIVPLFFAFFVWILIKSIRSIILKYFFIVTKIKLSFWLVNILSFGIFIVPFWLMSILLNKDLEAFNQSLPLYEEKFTIWGNEMFKALDKNLRDQIEIFISEINFSAWATLLFNSIYDLITNIFVVLIYVIFLIIEEHFFNSKVKALFPNPKKYEMSLKTLRHINHTIKKYLALKTLMSILTGFLSYIVFRVIGLEFAFLFAFIIFVFNYIPFVGSIIATVFSALFGLAQFEELRAFLIILIVVGMIQILIGNLLEPKLMGSSFNMSAIVVLVSLVFWGNLWGIVGMIFSIPLMVIISIICCQFEQTKFISILISNNGKTGKF